MPSKESGSIYRSGPSPFCVPLDSFTLVIKMSTTWEHVAADKRGRIDKSIPSEWKISTPLSLTSVIDVPASSGVLSPQELKITDSTASELVPRLAKGQLKAVDVTLAFCKRAALAHQLVVLPAISVMNIIC